MSSYTYSLVAAESSEVDEEEISEKDVGYSSSGRRSTILIFTGVLFGLISLSTNLFLLYEKFHHPWKLYNDIPTQYAGLRHNVPKPVNPPEEYSSLNRTIQDAAWNVPSLNSWDLIVALDEDYTVSQGLLHSQRWPWDLSKGVYILSAAHEMHCVNVIRSYVNEKDDGVPDADLVWNYAHTIHCLNILRDSVMCHADDRPMYTGRLHENTRHAESEPGKGTVKMCRDWDKLMDWAHANSACYLSTHRGDPAFREVDRYKFCPDGSRPWERVESQS